jgi:hypothetical protein
VGGAVSLRRERPTAPVGASYTGMSCGIKRRSCQDGPLRMTPDESSMLGISAESSRAALDRVYSQLQVLRANDCLVGRDQALSEGRTARPNEAISRSLGLTGNSVLPVCGEGHLV